MITLTDFKDNVMTKTMRWSSSGNEVSILCNLESITSLDKTKL